MNIEVKGNSGCGIEIIDGNGFRQLLVRKSTDSPDYFSRLKKQYLKQYNAEMQMLADDIDFINVPHVYEYEGTADSQWFTMDYVYSKNFIDFIESASPEEIVQTAFRIGKFIEYEFNNSSLQEVPRSVFTDKIDSVIAAYINNMKTKLNFSAHPLTEVIRLNHLLQNDVKQVFESLPETIGLPIGMCHGDLTFSNMLFTENGISLIDFLDSFVESPLQDIVKLRQDTCYEWSTLMYGKPYESVRLKTVFRMIDDFIVMNFKNDPAYEAYYIPMQIMNLARIAPYAKNYRVVCFLYKNISKLCDLWKEQNSL